MRSLLSLKTLFVFLFVIMSLGAYSQKSVDGIYLFKMWFYIEHVNQNCTDDNEYFIKDSTLFSFYITHIKIKVDTLKSIGFSDNYVFLSVNTSTDKKLTTNNISFNYTEHLGYLYLPTDNCKAYILCVNKVSGRSYRLQGFYGNDFLNLLKETRENYKIDNSSTLLMRKFFQRYIVQGLDFICIYDGLTSKRQDSKKYPCLMNCTDEIITIH